MNDGLLRSIVAVVARVDERDADGLGAFENNARDLRTCAAISPR